MTSHYLTTMDAIHTVLLAVSKPFTMVHRVTALQTMWNTLMVRGTPLRHSTC